MIGIVTTTVFIVLGGSLVIGGNMKVGAVLMALGLLRGTFAARQISSVFEAEEEPPDMS